MREIYDRDPEGRMIAESHILKVLDSLYRYWRGWAAGFCPAPIHDDQSRPGDEIYLHTYLVVRQDLLNLYGFESREERELFSLLLSVDGIGPKSALGVLSVLSPDAIRRAVIP